MPDKPRSFQELVAAQDPADRARLANAESFKDVMVRNPFQQEVTVIEDRDGTGGWNTSVTTVPAMSRCLPVPKPRGGLVTISTRSNSDGYGQCEPSHT
jgi:hypothetical protein